MKPLALAILVALACVGSLRAQAPPPPTTVQWGLPGDLPVVGDFDGDGRADLTVFRPATGTWFLRLSSEFYDLRAARRVQFGLPGDVPTASDYDGDGIADFAVYRPSTGTWYLQTSSTRAPFVYGFSAGTSISGTATAFTIHTGPQASSSGGVILATSSDLTRLCVASTTDPTAGAIAVISTPGQRLTLLAAAGTDFREGLDIAVVCQTRSTNRYYTLP